MNEDSRVLFGVASPIVVDYEESLVRLSLTLEAAVSVDGAVRLLNREKLVSFDALTSFGLTVGFLPCAFSPVRRRSLFEKAVSAGLRPAPALVDAHAVVARSTRVGDGSFINSLAVIGGASLIGTCVVVNRAANIGHHCVLSDFVSIGPGSTLAGNVRIGASATIGAGAVIFPDVRIGAGAVVSGGSVVRQDVPENAVASGNPARRLKMNPNRTQIWTSTQE